MEAERYRRLLEKQRDVMVALRQHVTRLQDELRRRRKAEEHEAEHEAENEAKTISEAEAATLRDTMTAACREVRRLREALARKDSTIREMKEEGAKTANAEVRMRDDIRHKIIALRERETAVQKREADVETAIAMKEAQWQAARLEIEGRVNEALLRGKKAEKEAQRLRHAVAQKERELADKNIATTTSSRATRRGSCGAFGTGSSKIKLVQRTAILALLAGLAYGLL